MQHWKPATWLKVSTAVALATIVLKTLAWWLTDSVALLSDAMESFVNLAGAMFAWRMVVVAEQPADDDHPYGHHKAEYFSSGFEGILILGAAGGILWSTVDRWMNPQALQALDMGLGLSVLSSVLNGFLAWGMLRAAQRFRSKALEGDARHLFTDVWTSAGVIVGLLLAWVTGWWWLDLLAAALVALNIAREGVHLIWESSQGLMDEAVDADTLNTISEVLAEFEHAREGTPIVRFDHLYSRRAGHRCFVDVHMHMPGTWSLQRAAAVRASVEQALMAAVPGLRATIQLLPSDVESLFHEAQDIQ
jgi:cation diffusion facilitator family transporter